MIEAREYQTRAVSEVVAILRAGSRTMLVAPTGSGKTVMGDAIVREFRGRIVWIAHRRELLDQAKRQLEKNLGEPVGIVSGSKRSHVDARIVVASVQKVPDLRGVELVVVDEAHRTQASTYRSILDDFEGRVLGLTATPWRLDGRGFGDVFDLMVVAAKPSELIEWGYATEPKVFGVSAHRAREIVAKAKVGADGDFRGKDVVKTMLAGSVVAEWVRHAAGSRTLVFAINRAHARDITSRFIAEGVAAEWVDGSTPQTQRDSTFARLASGETTVVVGVDVFTEGFDIPAVRCVSLARPTRSLTQYLQACGRAARKFGNSIPIIIDHAGNVYRHGMPTQDREWSLVSRSNGEGSTSAPLRCCHACEAIVPLSSVSCPECSEELRITTREIEEIEDIRLIELRLQNPIHELRRRRRSLISASKRNGGRLPNGMGREWKLLDATLRRLRVCIECFRGGLSEHQRSCTQCNQRARAWSDNAVDMFRRSRGPASAQTLGSDAPPRKP